MNNNMDFNNLLNEVRDEQIDPAVVEAAASRVWSRVGTIRSCADFQALLPAWRSGTLVASRRTLLEDHLHECVACRHAAEAGKVLAFPHLRDQAPLAKKPSILQMPVFHTPAFRFAMAAMMMAALGIGGWGILRSIWNSNPWKPSTATVRTADGQLFRLHNEGLVAVKAGEVLPAGEEIRTGRNSRAVIRLKDGSQVEMRERSAFVVTETASDLNVQLSRGAVIVQAAHRSAGHLFVTTNDCKVAVTGTVFSVEGGIKGSRVSVIEGEVHVTPNTAVNNQSFKETILHPGDQTSTDSSMERTPISEAFNWSLNSAEHLALLKEAASIEADLAKIQQPGMRYSSRLLGRLPDNTVFYMAMPNIGQQLGQAQEVLAQHVKESPALQQWWAQKGTANSTFNKVVDSIRGFSEYVGEEVVITATSGVGSDGKPTIQSPMLVAELKRSGFKEFAQSQLTNLIGDGKSHIQFVEDPAAAVGDQSNDLLISVSNDMLVITPDSRAMRAIAPSVKSAALRSGGSSAPFMARLEQAYQGGIGFLFAADLGTMTSIAASHIATPQDQASLAPLGNLSYLLLEQRDAGATTDTHATLTFAGDRKGIFAWLAKPSPMAALEYVTPQATAVTGFAVTNPGQVIDDVLSWASANNSNFPKDLSTLESNLGFSIRNDLAASLGSEVVFAVDGPLLPVPSWKVVAEVYDPGKLQWVFTKLITDANSTISQKGGSQLQVSQQVVGNLIYYKIVSPDTAPFGEIDYVFTGGYLIMAPSSSLLDQAMQAKSTGESLPRSAAFRGTLPHDREANFSALAYSNAGDSVNSLLTMLNSKLSPADRKRMESLTGETKPSLVGAYGESDRIVISSQGLIGLGSGSVMNMAGPFSLFSLLHSAHNAAQGH